MRARFSGQVEFLAVYIREAHPTDGWRVDSNDRYGITFAQPQSYDERLGIATQCRSALELGMPLLVDAIDNRVEKVYGAFPDRLYLVDLSGRVAFKGGRGPFGFEPRKLEQSLVMLLLDQVELAAERVADGDE